MPTEELALKVSVDKKSLRDSLKALDLINDGAQDTAKALEQMNESGDFDVSSMQLAIERLGELDAKVKVTANDLEEARKGMEGLEGAKLDKQKARVAQLSRQYAQLNQQIGQIPGTIKSIESVDLIGQQEAQFSRQRERVAAFGDIESAGRTVGGGIGAIGGRRGQQVESAISLAAELPAVAEALPLLGTQLANVGVRATKAGGLIGKMATAGATLAPALIGVSAGMGAILGVVLPFAAIAAVAAFAMSALTSANKEAAEQAKRTREAVEAEAETFATFTQALESGDRDAAFSQYQSLLEDRERLELESQQRQLAAGEAATESAEQGSNAWNALRRFVGETEVEATSKQLTESAEELADELTVTNAKITEAEGVLGDYGISLDDATAAAAEAREQEEELSQERERAGDNIAKLTAQEAQLQSRRGQQLAQQAQDRGIADAREAEDLAEAQADRAKQQAGIIAEGGKAINAITSAATKERTKIVSKGAEDERQARIDGANKIINLRGATQKAELKAAQKFAIDKAKQEQGFRNAEFDAILANDIIAASRAERGFDEGQTQAQSDFSREQTERKAQSDERLRTIAAENVARIDGIRANLQKELIERRKALAERLGQEKASQAERAKSDAAQQAKAEKDRLKRLKRAEEDEVLKDKRADDAFKEQLAAIESRKNAEREAIQATFTTIQHGAESTINAVGKVSVAVIGSIGSAAQQWAAKLAQVSGSSTKSISGGFTTAKGIRKFAGGGAYTAGELIRVNDSPGQRTEFFRSDQGGRILPLAPRDEMLTGSGSRGGGGDTINIDLSVGDIATGNQVIRAIRGAYKQSARVDIRATADALGGV